MRIHAAIAGMTEIILIAVMGAIGAYAFLASSAYEGMKAFSEAHDIGFIPYLPFIIWLLVSGFGIVSIVLFNRGSGVFTWLVVIFSLPSLIAHNNVDWFSIIKLDITPTTSLDFTSMLALGVLTITGYVILNYLRFFKESEKSMIKRQADRNDIEEVNGFSNLSLFIAVCTSLGATAVVGFLALGLEKLAQGAVNALPWNTVFIGLFCFLLLAFYLYWVAARRREKGNEENNTDKHQFPL